MTNAFKLVLAAACVAASGAIADPLRLRFDVGATSLQSGADSLAADLGQVQAHGLSGGVRAMWEGGADALTFEVHGVVGVLQGDLVALSAPSGATPPLTALDLRTTLVDREDLLVEAAIDRFSVTWATDMLVLKLGRQAITWGNGLVFHPSDIVAPFSPDAIDKSYKPGADMAYAQVLFDNGADIQAIALPRPATDGGDIQFGSSTYAVLGSTALGPLDARALLGRDRGDKVAGLGLSGPLGGMSWTAEKVWRETDAGETVHSGIFNISTFGSIGEMNASYFVEYYHNGFGVPASVALDDLPGDLSDRLATGQIFYPGRDFLALGAQVQLTENLFATPSAIMNLNDDSALWSFGLNYSVNENTDLALNAFVPVGGHGTEFGGRETSAGSGVWAETPESLTLRFVTYR